MNDLRKETVTFVTVDESGEGQRVDNFLFTCLKGVPKSHIYRILRTGQVRLNGKRVDATNRLAIGDQLRIPPVRTGVVEGPRPVPTPRSGRRLLDHVLYRDDAILVLDKPSGMAVHGGSGVSFGVIEQLRAELPESRFLELAHRLDRETSGVLVVACKRSALVRLHDLFRSGGVDKRYLALVPGQWRWPVRHIDLPLYKFLDAQGERRVMVRDDGKPAHTVFRLQQTWPRFSLLEAELKTGRTHQIRVHLAQAGFAIAGDDKYGDFALNREWAREGLKRMFLHARRLAMPHPLTGVPLQVEAPLPADLRQFLDSLGQPETT